MLTGDTHGDLRWFRSYLLPVAHALKVENMVVLGDFGAWEHTSAGVQFFDEVDRAAGKAKIVVYWLHGNHDKWSHTMAAYGHDRTSDGFVVCRENLFYIPQGHAWTWGGVSLRSFGGAYSIDKAWRLDTEKAREQHLLRQLRAEVGAGSVTGGDSILSQAGTLWFPEEEMRDDDMEQLLLDDFAPKDIILSHDKPMSAKPGWNRKDFPACVPNQLRLERALQVHKPQWWFHGHLHYFYNTTLSVAGRRTNVIGLEPNENAAEQPSWRPDQTWVLADLVGESVIRLGQEAEPGGEKLVKARKIFSRLD